jgi:hypothetical protein
MTPIDPPSEGQAPRAASAGLVQPPPRQLDKLAESLISEGGGPGDSLHSWRCEYPDRYGPCDCVAETVRELWDAVAEGLGLREETRTGVRAGDCDGRVTREPDERRLVSKWEPQP